jgi:hypothetical protein
MENLKSNLMQSLKTILDSHYDDLCDRIFTANNNFSKRLDKLQIAIDNIKNDICNKNKTLPIYSLSNSVVPNTQYIRNTEKITDTNSWTYPKYHTAKTTVPKEPFNVPLQNRFAPLIDHTTAKYQSECFNIKFVNGDIFDAPADVSFVQCLSSDIHAGAGIAKQFRVRFGGIDYLKSQKRMLGTLQCYQLEMVKHS